MLSSRDHCSPDKSRSCQVDSINHHVEIQRKGVLGWGNRGRESAVLAEWRLGWWDLTCSDFRWGHSDFKCPGGSREGPRVVSADSTLEVSDGVDWSVNWAEGTAFGDDLSARHGWWRQRLTGRRDRQTQEPIYLLTCTFSPFESAFLLCLNGPSAYLPSWPVSYFRLPCSLSPQSLLFDYSLDLGKSPYVLNIIFSGFL